MSISSKYNPVEVEDKWYSYWMEKGFFNSTPDEREPYTVVIPPPNVTGVLHMGHMLNNTIQDVLIRRARMLGKNACWVPGTDHASIATETKVVNKLKDEGIDKNDLTRDEFLKHAWEWTEKHGGIILEQLKKLGASCDWNRTRFTMEDDMSESVIKVFIDLYNKGYIYRGVRMINWDPQAQTALSDEEVIHKEVNSKLYHLKYKVAGADEYLTIATTRPETILGDTAICINPNDERYKNLQGKSAIVPLINREIPIIFDEYVDMEFGTGCLKVTPAHDINDYELGIKHNLETIDILNDDGTLNDKAGLHIGVDRFKARKLIVKDIDEAGQLAKVDDLVNNVGYSERTNCVIEPKLSLQWFCKMEELAKPALDHVMNDDIQFHPSKFKNSYKHWMENVKDWCISRQLWWGHQIPAWYYGKGANDYVVAKTAEEALAIIEEKTSQKLTTNDIRQDDDALDTWFSSWLWPMSVFNGINEPDNEEINYYYPTNDLVTAPEIMFFWVARMVISGYEYRGDLPFKNVYYTGIVRDQIGRKMSKSLGNSPDPIDLMNKYGADGVRVGMLLCSPAGNDLPFDEKLCEQGNKFSNKIWNAYRLIDGWETSTEADAGANQIAIDWFKARFNQTIVELEEAFSKFRLSDALMKIYKLVWDDFCSWYLEMVKPAYGDPIDTETKATSLALFEEVLKIVHPFMPFITEELWHAIKEREEMDCILVAEWPKPQSFDQKIIDEVAICTEVVSQIRTIRNQKQIAKHEKLELFVKSENKSFYNEYAVFIQKIGVLASLTLGVEDNTNTQNFVVKADEFFIPMEAEEINKEDLEKELAYTVGFLKSVDKKLSNERFVSNAPAQVIEKERLKRSDAEAKIKALEASLAQLN